MLDWQEHEDAGGAAVFAELLPIILEFEDLDKYCGQD